MQLPTYVALSRLVAQQRSLDVTATNLANAGTPGFKAERVVFSDWISRQPATDGAAGIKSVAFTQDRATYREQQAGTLEHTGNPLDLAVSGNGFFTVDTAQGPRLTRAGRFTPSAGGRLADSDGNALLDTAGAPIRVTGQEARIQISGDGTISSESGPIGKIGVVEPADVNRMTAEGARLLRSDSPTKPVKTPQLVQGAVEASNVQPILELTRMMAGLRSFEFTSQFVQSEGERQQSTIDKLTQQKV